MHTTKKHTITITGNEATARIAYKTNEVCAIYPITPSSEMSELVEEWSAENKKNLFGSAPSVFEMQSEAGVAGALHGALTTGSLATTFTASQGLLLMLPNMYKIAGELTPNVIHVATRSVATHALSVFGDHSDIMAARTTGYAFLGGASVQEAHDFALIAQAATLESRIPFVHFFDGFRTSHETSTIESISDDVITKMMDQDLIAAHRTRGLSSNAPVLRGTAQGPDVFFQSREAVNSYYDACPDIVQNQMDKFAALTGRQYRLFDYVGHSKAERVIIAMASACETIEETVKHLCTLGEKVGLIKVRLFRPFSTKHVLEALPTTCKSIAVLDRTKEPGSNGEPLYQDIVNSITSVTDTRTYLQIVGGRYGLSSKEFNPNMVKAVFDNLKSEAPKNNFTIGINDDKTNLSLPYGNDLHLEDDSTQILFYETKSKYSCKSFNKLLQIIGDENYVQGYSEIDYKKSGSRFVSNLRVAKQPIKAPYLISNADFIACDSVAFLENDNVLQRIKIDGKLLVQTTLRSREFWASLSLETQNEILLKNVQLFTVNGNVILEKYAVEDKMVSGLHACILALQEEFFIQQDLEILLKSISEVDTSILEAASAAPIEMDAEFIDSLLGKLMTGRGAELPVSAIPADGTYPTDTSKFNSRNNGNALPEWDADACTQCGACSMACPQGAIRIKAYDDSYLENAPAAFQSVKAIDDDFQIDLLNYTVQVNPDQCTSCNNCVDACPAKALVMKGKSEIDSGHNSDNACHTELVEVHSKYGNERENWKHFETIPEFDRTKLDTKKVSQQQLQEPLFKYSIGVDGCGEAPYLKLLSQLFGNRMLVANATGASSIFGGALPSTPWAKNAEGRGPAWSNSLFEDNAEFGLGYRLTLDQQEQQARTLIKELLPLLDFDLAHDIVTAEQNTEQQIQEQRQRVQQLKAHLTTVAKAEAQQLMTIADSLVKQSVWIVGGDGWAYDIGYGGLDHVMASGKNVNILVLDNEVYSNTGGQMSKATPFGATAKFTFNGKQKQKKDLGRLMMTYDDVYVAQVAIGADQEQTLKAFQEAESFDGPSIIIAYCHSPAHGIDMQNPSQYHKAAVASGQWSLYRNDPRRMEAGLKPLQLDSAEPSIPIEDYLRMEGRFAKLLSNNQSIQREQFEMLQNRVDRRYQSYLSQASPIQFPIMELNQYQNFEV